MKRVRSVSPQSLVQEQQFKATKSLPACSSKSASNSTDTTLTSSNTTCNANTSKDDSSTTNLNGDKATQSWRSTGWTPLAYPSSALYITTTTAAAATTTTTSSSNDTKEAIADANEETQIIEGTKVVGGEDNVKELKNVEHKQKEQQQQNQNKIALNPYFPLHKDVILASIRELLILDQSIDSKTLEVVVHNHDIRTNTNTSSSSSTTTTTTTKCIKSKLKQSDKEMKNKKNHVDLKKQSMQQKVSNKIQKKNEKEKKDHTEKRILQETTMGRTTTSAQNQSIESAAAILKKKNIKKKQKNTGKRNRINSSNAYDESIVTRTIGNISTTPTTTTTGSSDDIAIMNNNTAKHVSFVATLRHIMRSFKNDSYKTTAVDIGDQQPLKKKAKIVISPTSDCTTTNVTTTNTTNHYNFDTVLEEEESKSKSSKVYDVLRKNGLIKNPNNSDEEMKDFANLNAEDIAHFILSQCTWDADASISKLFSFSNGRCGNENDESETDHNNNNNSSSSNVPSFIRLANDNDGKNNASNTNHSKDESNQKETTQTPQQKQKRPPRKVSDVDDMTFVSCVNPFSSDISPHLAVIAFNIDSDCDQNIIDLVKNLMSGKGLGHDGDNMNNTMMSSIDQQSIILEQIMKHDTRMALPDLVNISIMIEAHLRRAAYHMTDCLISHFHPKVLREFLGYKSSAMKKDRILHLLSDYLFDVSHAMFAWDHTEAETYGSLLSSSPLSLDDEICMIRDKKICDSLFDNRALRKIGGFDSSSLLYHAISMKRVCSKGQTWADLAKSSAGKKMLCHHCDDNARLQVGQLRRGQRVRKSRAVYYPMIVSDKVTGNGGVGGIGAGTKPRSRSSSFASVESEITSKQNLDNGFIENSVYGEISNAMQVKSFMPDSLSITVTREDTDKSWGILLAKEGSMCVVMRVPNDDASCQGAQLEKGDLIVSILNERNEVVNTPTHSSSSEKIASDWFSKAVSLFKSSRTLHLNVTRVLRAPVLN